MWMAADYAVQVQGLCDGLDERVPSSERVTEQMLRARLFEDLDDAGFPTACIKQIEVYSAWTHTTAFEPACLSQDQRDRLSREDRWAASAVARSRCSRSSSRPT